MSAGQLRIVYLISKYPAVSMTFILREVVALREQGLLIDVASINLGPADDALTQLERDEVARTFYIKPQGAMGAIKSIAWFLFHRPAALFAGLSRAISLGSPDPPRMMLCLFYLLEAVILARWMYQRNILTHLHVHFASQASTVALLATYLAPVTLSITVHGPDEFYDVPGYFLPAKMERSSFVACISFFTQSQLMKIVPGSQWHKFEVSRLGVDTSHFVPHSVRPAADPIEILCVGRLVRHKGQRILIDAVERLHRSGRAVHLTLVGEGPDGDDLEQRVRERSLTSLVTFTGPLNQDQIQAFYAACDIFTLASFAEGIPVALMEAMSLEIPCVATIINGIPELIHDGVNGLLVSPSDLEGLVVALALLIDDPALRRSLGDAGRIRVQQAYELKISIAHLAEIFRTRLAAGQVAGEGVE